MIEVLLLPRLLLACAGSPAPAETADPDETAETGDTAADDTGDTGDTSVPDACPVATVTFEHADTTVEDVTPYFLSGDYLTLDAPGRLLVCPGTWYARVLIRADVEVLGLGGSPDQTVLSGGASGTILDIAGPDVSVSVANVTLDRGAGLDVEHNSGGGGLYCDAYSTVSVSSVVFTNNTANDGAALYGTDCEVSVADSVFADNVSEDDGGAFTLWYSHATITDTVFSGNTALDGGALALFYGSATMSDVVFEDNTSGNFSGAVWVYRSDITLSDATLSRNVNTGGDAGGMLVYGSAVLERVAFTDNSAPKGGGLFVYYEAVVEGTDCRFSGNAPDDIYAADYTEAGGASYTAGDGYSFSCAGNVCAER